MPADADRGSVPYGQEARPYGLVLLGAVDATVLWSVMIRDGRYRWMLGYALTVVLRPNLLIGRYLLLIVPAWVVLAGLGTMTLAEIAQALLYRLRVPRPGAGGVAAAVVGAALVATLAAQAPTLTAVRTVHGHGDDIRPALVVATGGAGAGLPIVVSSRPGATLVGAYSPAAAQRMIGLRLEPAGTMIWPVAAPAPVRVQMLRRQSRVLLLRNTPAAARTVRA